MFKYRNLHKSPLKPFVFTIIVSVFSLVNILHAEETMKPVDALKQWLDADQNSISELKDQKFSNNFLSKDEAREASKLLWEKYIADLKETRKSEWDAKKKKSAIWK